MENSSLALKIAGGVLISMLIISLGVVSWNRFSKVQKEKENAAEIKSIRDFNKEFESYNKDIVRGYELVSLANLANDTNKKYSEVDGFKKFNVYISMKSSDAALSSRGSGAEIRYNNRKYFDFTDFANNIWHGLSNGDKKAIKDLYFRCVDVKYDKSSGRIITLYFNEITKVED